MKFATLNDGSRNGQFIIVSRDLKTAVIASQIAPTLQHVLDSWTFMAPQCEDLYTLLNQGRAPYSFDFNPANCMAPLPRAFDYVTGGAYPAYEQHIAPLMPQIASHSSQSDALIPQQKQALSDGLLGAHAEIIVPNEQTAIDIEAGLAMIVGDFSKNTLPKNKAGLINSAAEQCRLIMLTNQIVLMDVSVNQDAVITAESHSASDKIIAKTLSSFSPVAITPDELGQDWGDGRVTLPLRFSVRGKLVGQPNAGVDMVFNFPQLVAQIALNRDLNAGNIVGTGAIFNANANKGSASIAAIRSTEMSEKNGITTAYLQAQDSVKTDMLDNNGKSIFGAIEHKVLLRD